MVDGGWITWQVSGVLGMGDDMKLVNCEDCSNGFKWECRRCTNSKRHKVELSIRAGSWFEQSKMTLEEILKYSYWWCQELDQANKTRTWTCNIYWRGLAQFLSGSL